MSDDQEVIRAIEELLDRAYDGTLEGFACVTLEPGGEVGQMIAGSIKTDKFKTLAAIEILKRDVMDGVERLKGCYPKEFENEVDPPAEGTQ